MSAVATSLTGTLGLEVVARGSKSERKAYILRTGKKGIILRLMGENPFEVDESPLKKLVGKKVKVTGVSRDPYFFASSYSEEK